MILLKTSSRSCFSLCPDRITCLALNWGFEVFIWNDLVRTSFENLFNPRSQAAAPMRPYCRVLAPCWSWWRVSPPGIPINMTRLLVNCPRATVIGNLSFVLDRFAFSRAAGKVHIDINFRQGSRYHFARRLFQYLFFVLVNS